MWSFLSYFQKNGPFAGAVGAEGDWVQNWRSFGKIDYQQDPTGRLIFLNLCIYVFMYFCISVLEKLAIHKTLHVGCYFLISNLLKPDASLISDDRKSLAPPRPDF